MTDREKKELIEAEETILQLFFDAYERAMKYTKGNNKDYISCRNPAATKQQETDWNRMVRNLEHRKAKENHRKEVKTNGRNA